MPRLFTAIELPQAIKQQILGLHSDDLPNARWSRQDQMHITLHFIGEISQEQATATQQALEKVQSYAFSLALAEVGQFPPKGKARVLWAGLRVDPMLNALHSRIARALQPTGFVPDERPFEPHLTVARFKPPTPRAALEAYFYHYTHYERFETPAFPVTEFLLYESELRPEGARYTVRQRYPLVDPA